jgi:hypothetical protein
MAALALAVLLTMQSVEDLAEQAGVDAIELQGAVNTTGLEPVVYLRMTGELPTPVTSVTTPYGVWDRLAECESGGNWHINGYHDGGLQFLPSTWNAYGGRAYAPFAYQATREQQIAIARKLQAAAGWGQWPACSRRLGLR